MQIVAFDGTPIEGRYGRGARAALFDTEDGSHYTTNDGRALEQDLLEAAACGGFVTKVDPPLDVTFRGILLYKHKNAAAPSIDATWVERGDIFLAHVTAEVAKPWLSELDRQFHEQMKMAFQELAARRKLTR